MFLRAKRVAAASVFAGLAFSVPVQAQETISLTISSGYPLAFIWANTMENVFIPAVDRKLQEAGGEYVIDWTRAWGGQLGGPADQGDLVQIGAVDIGNVVLPQEQDILPLGSVAFTIPFGSPDIGLATRTMHEMHERVPAMADAWTNAGMRYLTAVALDNYHIMSNFPINSVEDLNGRKIGAVGLNQNWIRNTGAAPVAITAVSTYNDLQTGVIDGVILTPAMLRSGRVYEVATHLNMISFGAIYQLPLAVNLDRWESLPEIVQVAIDEAAVEWMDTTIERLFEAEQAALEYFEEIGIVINEISPEERARWAETLPNVPLEWAGEDENRLTVVREYILALEEAGHEFPRDWLEGQR